MASPALGMSKPSTEQSNLAAQKLQIEHALKGSSGWFIAIAISGAQASWPISSSTA